MLKKIKSQYKLQYEFCFNGTGIELLYLKIDMKSEKWLPSTSNFSQMSSLF